MSDFPAQIIADDYGLGMRHDMVIRELLDKRALTGTSVLVDHCDGERADALSAALAKDQQLGLHLNLTLSPPDTQDFPNVRDLLRDALKNDIAAEVVRSVFAAQLDRFRAMFGRDPDFLDGHEHVHTFPGIRAETLALAAQVPGAWVRSTVPANLPRALLNAGVKVLPIAWFGHRLRAELDAAGIPTNRKFSGLLNLADPHSVARDLPILLGELTDGTVLMVHPGSAADPSATEGHSNDARYYEAKILRSVV